MPIAGELELGVADTSGAARHPTRLAIDPVAEYALHFFVRPGHPLMSGAPPTLAEYSRFRWRCREFHSGSPCISPASRRSSGLIARPAISCGVRSDDFSVVRFAVAAGDAVDWHRHRPSRTTSAAGARGVPFEAPWLRANYGVFRSRNARCPAWRSCSSPSSVRSMRRYRCAPRDPGVARRGARLRRNHGAGARRADVLRSITMLACLFGLAAQAHSASPPVAPPATLRVDLVHTGGRGLEVFAIDRVVLEPLPWPGRPARQSTSDSGLYRFEVREPGGRLLYSRGYSSIYAEWATTAEAREHRTFHESLRFPRRPRLCIVVQRRNRPVVRDGMESAVDPADMFVERAAPRPQPLSRSRNTVSRATRSTCCCSATVIPRRNAARISERRPADARRAVPSRAVPDATR